MSARITTEVKVAFVYQGLNGKKSRCATIRGACRKLAAELIDRQYKERRRRCACGRRDIFCDSNTKADRHNCAVKKTKRIVRIAKFFQRKVTKVKKKHERNNQPAIEFNYSFDV